MGQLKRRDGDGRRAGRHRGRGVKVVAQVLDHRHPVHEGDAAGGRQAVGELGAVPAGLHPDGASLRKASVRGGLRGGGDPGGAARAVEETEAWPFGGAPAARPRKRRTAVEEAVAQPSGVDLERPAATAPRPRAEGPLDPHRTVRRGHPGGGAAPRAAAGGGPVDAEDVLRVVRPDPGAIDPVFDNRPVDPGQRVRVLPDRKQVDGPPRVTSRDIQLQVGGVSLNSPSAIPVQHVAPALRDYPEAGLLPPGDAVHVPAEGERHGTGVAGRHVVHDLLPRGVGGHAEAGNGKRVADMDEAAAHPKVVVGVRGGGIAPADGLDGVDAHGPSRERGGGRPSLAGELEMGGPAAGGVAVEMAGAPGGEPVRGLLAPLLLRKVRIGDPPEHGMDRRPSVPGRGRREGDGPGGARPVAPLGLVLRRGHLPEDVQPHLPVRPLPGLHGMDIPTLRGVVQGIQADGRDVEHELPVPAAAHDGRLAPPGQERDLEGRAPPGEPHGEGPGGGEEEDVPVPGRAAVDAIRLGREEVLDTVRQRHHGRRPGADGAAPKAPLPRILAATRRGPRLGRVAPGDGEAVARANGDKERGYADAAAVEGKDPGQEATPHIRMGRVRQEAEVVGSGADTPGGCAARVACGVHLAEPLALDMTARVRGA